MNSTVPDYVALLPGLRALAREAGAAIMDVYSQPFEVLSKDDNSPVTAADIKAEAIILAGLAKLTPDIPVVSEEAAAAGKRFDVSGGRFWLVDPLDGTKEFVARNGEFTVNIGLIDNGVPVAGVLFAPVLDRLFLAAPGIATVEDRGAAPRPIAVRPIPKDGMRVLSSRSHRDPATFDDYMKHFPVADIRRSGSSLKFALVAAGEADIYPRFGRTMEWDTAAGHAVLLAAGGCMTLPDGSPLLYGKSGFENPPVVAWGSSQPNPPKA
jgi:3'(2'), 5'-bisphosphate nucleotidase